MSVNRPIPAMYQGVSQQPAALRAAEQCEALVNGYPTVADGERKRPPAQYVAKLSTWTPANAKVHQYFRGDGEHNVVVIGANGDTTTSILAFNGTDGSPRAVDWVTHADAFAYIQSTNPMDEIDCLTVADTTFIWNRTKTVEALTSALTAASPKLYLYVKEGRPDTDYTVDLAGYGAPAYATNDTASSYSTTKIALELKNAINALVGTPFVATQVNNLVTVRRSDNSDFQFTIHDSAGSTCMAAFKNSVERYSDLPRFCEHGVIVEVKGQGDTGGKGSYWVKFQRPAAGEQGYWEETTKPDPTEPTELDPATMPVKLVRMGDGTFQLQTIEWSPRLVGSTTNDSAPVPSIVGLQIAAMFFARGRLGLLAGENVVMSRARDLYNLWPKSAAVDSDDDPIDATADSPRVSELRHAAPFQRQIMLFSDTAQFPLNSGNEALTAKTARVDPATEYDCSKLVKPVSSGKNLFFVYERASSGGTYSGVREYSINQTSITHEAVDVTAHVPQYIPRNVYAASVSSTEDLLLLLTKEEYSRVYFYKYLWSANDKVQSAWGYWDFPSNKVISAHVEKTTVSLVMQRADGLYLTRMELQSTTKTPGLDFQLHLDDLVLLPTSPPSAGYFAPQDYTQIVMPYDAPLGQELVIVAGDGHGTGAGTVLTPFFSSGPLRRVRGDWSAGDLWVGVKYEHRHTFSEQFMRDGDGNALQQGRLQLKHMTVAFKDAVTFRADVATPGRDTASYRYRALKVGIAGSLIGSPVMASGKFTFPVASQSDRATITLINDSPYSATFYAAEWEGEFRTRSPRR